MIFLSYPENKEVKGRLQEKKSKKSDIVTKGRVGWDQKTFLTGKK